MNLVRPVVTSIRFSYARQRPKPKLGDRRTTKAHGQQVRLFTMARNIHGRVIGYLCNGGRQNYHWATHKEAVAEGYGHLLTPEERLAATGKATLPCKSPYCECEAGRCSTPGRHDARGAA